MSKSFFLILFLVGFILTQVVDYLEIAYLDTAGVALMVLAAVSYMVVLLIAGLRDRAASKKPQDQ